MFPIGGGTLPAYKKKVDRMSKPELRQEYAKQQRALWAASHGIHYDPRGVKLAQAKLDIVTREMSQRGISIPRPMPTPYAFQDGFSS